MRTLIVCSKNSGKIAPFILEQAESLKTEGVEVDFFTITQKGLLGYLKSRGGLIAKINEFRPDVIHAHYGLSGLLANLQRRVPVVTTYHGSDINNRQVLRFSKIAIFLSKFNVFVSQKGIDIAKPKRHFALIPCGVDTELFKPLDQAECRTKLELLENEKLVLFSSAFDNQVKNPELAKAVLTLLPGVRLVELKGYNRFQVSELMNACDVALMTSFTEGSPQFIKEAMACNCPIVSVDVGDVKEVIKDVSNCYTVDYDANQIARRLDEILLHPVRTNGRKKIDELGIDLITVAKRICMIYDRVLNTATARSLSNQ